MIYSWSITSGDAKMYREWQASSKLSRVHPLRIRKRPLVINQVSFHSVMLRLLVCSASKSAFHDTSRQNINSELTEDFTYFRPLSLFLQDESELGADVDVADVVEQNPHHAPGQMHETAETHELTELEKNRQFCCNQRLLVYSFIPDFRLG